MNKKLRWYLINLTFYGAESWRRDTRVQLNTLMHYNIFFRDHIFYRDQNISCKLSSVFLMIKRLNGGIPEKKGLKSFRPASFLYVYLQAEFQRTIVSCSEKFPK